MPFTLLQRCLFKSFAGLRLPFVTADEQQRKAAQQLGLQVTWIPEI
jgi:hypothetical protein